MRHLVFFILLGVAGALQPSSGQSLFETKTTLLSQSEQRNFVLADDADQDGDQDLYTFQPSPDCCGGSYYLLYNDGEGNFSEEVLIATEEVEWKNVRAGDLDDDGLRDIIVYNPETEEITWLRNNGGQEYIAKGVLLTTGAGGTFEVIDLTGDGRDDLVYVELGAETRVLLLENQGDETFADPLPIASGTLLQLADFDADGLTDVFTINQEGSTVVWHRNNGDITFTSTATNIENEIPFTTPDLLVADFTGNEVNELIISYSVSGDEGPVPPKIFSYDGSEFIQQSSLSDSDVFPYSPTNLAVSDIDQDGDLDIPASFRTALSFSRIQSDFDEFVGWYENEGNFLFTPRLLDDVLLEGEFIDLNSDQLRDVLFSTSEELIWQKNQGQGQFASPTYLTNSRALPVTYSEGAGSNINFGDLTQDGFPEMILSEGISNKVQYFANSDGTLATPPRLLALNTLRPTDATILEASGDQLNDLLLIGGDESEGLGIYLYTNQGDLLLKGKDTLYTGQMSPILFEGDFNGDTFSDIVLSDRSMSLDGEIFILSQKDQAFEVVDTRIIGTVQSAVDANNDGKTDIITQDGIYSQTSPEAFELIRPLNFAFNHAEDINGDSLTDFLLITEAEITLYLADESESYQEQTLTFDAGYDFSVTPWLWVDVDQDQDKDLVFINDTGTARELAYLQNLNGTTNFGAYTPIDSFDDLDFQLFSYDIDLDTDADLVVLTNTELAWYRSTASQEEVPENNAPTVANPLEDQGLKVDEEFSLTIADDVFVDVDEGDSLALTVDLSDGSPLPGWLSFDAQTSTLSGTPPKVGLSLAVQVTATDRADATVSDEFTLTVSGGTVTGLDDEQANDLLVYPVPATQQLFVESRRSGLVLQSFHLIDAQGRLMQSEQFTPGSGSTVQIDVSSLARGIYLLQLQSPDHTYRRRILIK